MDLPSFGLNKLNENANSIRVMKKTRTIRDSLKENSKYIGNMHQKLSLLFLIIRENPKSGTKLKSIEEKSQSALLATSLCVGVRFRSLSRIPSGILPLEALLSGIIPPEKLSPPLSQILKFSNSTEPLRDMEPQLEVVDFGVVGARFSTLVRIQQEAYMFTLFA